MAAKKTKTVKKPAAKKAPTTPRTALKLLETLPPLDQKRRRAYQNAFSDEECDAWGAKTRAESVLGEAERYVGALAGVLKKPVTGYSPARLAWLCTLVADLHEAVESDKASSADSARTERFGVFSLADKARKKLASGLIAAGTGNPAFQKEVTDRNDTPSSAYSLETSLTGLVQLALRLRRSEDGELLADDAGITEVFLSSVSATIDALHEANERTFTVERGKDSATTNRIEGRVLREMAFAQRSLRRAKDDGEAITLPVPGPQLRTVITSSTSRDAEPTPK